MVLQGHMLGVRSKCNTYLVGVCEYCNGKGKNTRCYSNSDAEFEVYIQDCM